MKIIKLSVIILLTYIHLSEGKMKSSTTHTHKKSQRIDKKKDKKNTSSYHQNRDCCC